MIIPNSPSVDEFNITKSLNFRSKIKEKYFSKLPAINFNPKEFSN